MIKRILYFIIFLLIVGISYLSYFGLSTNKFNSKIENKIKESYPNINVRLQDVKILLDILKLSMDSTDGFYNISDANYILNALLGGILISFCSHGVDYMMVQRTLCTKNLKSAQKAMIGSGFVVFIQFIIVNKKTRLG